MSTNGVTMEEMRQWMEENNLPDSWWVCNRFRIHGPMTLEAIEKEYIAASCKISIVHTMYQENHPWVEINPDVDKLKKTNRFVVKPHAGNVSALNKCWSRKTGANVSGGTEEAPEAPAPTEQSQDS